MALNLYRMAGRVRFNRLKTDATYAGYIDLGNLTKVEVGNSGADTTTYKSTSDLNYGSIIGSTTTPGDDTVNVGMNTLDRKNWAIILSGDDTDVSVTTGAITDETFVATLDTWVPLANYKWTAAAVTVTNNAGSITYVEDTDYVLDILNGFIMPLSTGAMVAASTNKIDYTKDNASGFKISARTQTVVTGKLMMIGTNMESQKRFRFQADSVEFTLDGVAALLSADNAALEYNLAGIIKLPAGETVPYTYIEYS